MKENSMSPWALCVPLPASTLYYSCNSSDLFCYQGILFSVIGAAIAVATRPELTDGQTTTLLHTIFLTLNHLAVPGETLVVPPLVGMAPPKDVANTISFFYESSLVSLFAVVFAMLAKECLGYYSLPEGVPAIYSSEDRRQTFDALDGWRFLLLVKTARCLIWTACLFLILGFWQRLCYAHPTIIYSLALLILPGLVGYLGTMVDIIGSRIVLGTRLQSSS